MKLVESTVAPTLHPPPKYLVSSDSCKSVLSTAKFILPIFKLTWLKKQHRVKPHLHYGKGRRSFRNRLFKVNSKSTEQPLKRWCIGLIPCWYRAQQLSEYIQGDVGRRLLLVIIFIFMNGSFIFYMFLFSPALISPLCTESGSQDSKSREGSRALHFNGENAQAAALDSYLQGSEKWRGKENRKTNHRQ